MILSRSGQPAKGYAQKTALAALAGSMLLGCAADKAQVSAAAGNTATVAAQKSTEPAAAPAPPTLRLLTQSQYANTIADIFGSDIVAKVRFAPVNRISGLVAIGAAKAGLTPGVIDPLDATARCDGAADPRPEASRSFRPLHAASGGPAR